MVPIEMIVVRLPSQTVLAQVAIFQVLTLELHLSIKEQDQLGPKKLI